MRRHLFLAALLPSALAVASAPQASTQEASEVAVESTGIDVAGSLGKLPGRWAGTGSARFENGKETSFRCVATYFLDEGKAAVRQNLRCNSKELQIALTTDWTVAGESISGTWRETKYELHGSLMGNVQDNGFSLFAENQHASAAISVRVSNCEQDVTMTFSREVQILTASLRKC